MQQVDSVVFTSDKYRPYFSFWKQFLEKGIDTFDFQQIQRPDAAKMQSEPLHYSFELDPRISKQMLKIVNDQDSGVMVILMVSVGVALSKYSEQSDIIISTPTFSQRGGEKRYVERVPIILNANEDQTFREVLVSFQNSVGEFYKYQNFPLSLIDYAALSSQGVFNSNIFFEFEGFHDPSSATEKADLKIKARRTEDKVEFILEINQDAFDTSFFENFSNHINQILGNLNQLDTKLKDILLGPSEQQIDLIKEFNSNRNYTPLKTTLIDSFEAQVSKSPNRIALVSRGKELTYAELNKKANCLAHHIKSEYSLINGDLVGIMLDRSNDLIISILGVLKSGCTYVPIDPEYPSDRKSYFLEDTQLKLLLTSSDYLFSISNYDGVVMAMDIQMPEIESDVDNLNLDISTEQPAYIIYTSGSTGKPKGVMVPHRGCLNMISAQISEFGMNEEDTTLQFSSISFDASVSEIFKTLFVGGKLVVMDKDITSYPEKLVDFMKDQGITVVTIPPSYLSVLSIKKLFFLRIIISAGEAANIRHATEFSKFGTYYNAYGPTECSVCVSVEKFNLDLNESKLAIGRPIANMTVHLMSKWGHSSPLGLPGEICVSGAGIACGYLNSPELSAQKFVKNPFNPEELLYRTGDIGRWLPDGRLEFIGRKDSQVKVRGFRIELSEIELCTHKHADIKDVVCVLREDRNQEKQVVLYFTSAEDLRASELRKYLETLVPHYMIPAHIIKINAFHFLPSGKINRKILPEVSESIIETDYIKPESDLEKKLAEIWASNLDKSRVGITDNFFAIGGDSIKAIRLAVDMNKTIGLNIEVNDIFSHNTIAGLIKNVIQLEDNIAEDASVSAEAEAEMEQFKNGILQNDKLSLPFDIEDVIPMSDIQKGMIFHSLIGADAGMYKEQMYFQLKDHSYDAKVFKDAVNIMVKRHAILRTSFLMEEGVSAQIIRHFQYSDDNLLFEDVSDKEREEQKKYLQSVLHEDKYKNLNIKDRVLWKMHTFKLSVDEYGIMFSCNHALVDGWSNASLMTELSHVYFALKQGIEYKVEPLKASYRDYIVDQLKISNSIFIKEFWVNELDEYVKSPLPFNKNIGDQHGVTNFTYELPEQLINDMVNLSETGLASLKHLFLSAFSFLLKFTTGENDLTFGLVTNSRPELEDGDKIIGCFTNTVPFRVKIESKRSVSDFASGIDSQAKKLKAFDKLSLIEIMKVIHEETTGANPIFDIIFNYVDFHIYETVHNSSEVSDGIIDEQPRGNTNTLFDFTVCKSDRNKNKFIVNLNYRSGLYDQSEIDRLFNYYIRILKLIVYNGKEALSTSLLFTENELKTIFSINENKKLVPENTIVEQFELQVQKSPDKLALGYRNEEYTYNELNAKANTLAAYLRAKHNIKPNDLVGIMATRSASTIIGILGILKAGGAYVPIGVDNPLERKKKLLSETGISVLLTESELMFSLLEYYNGEIFALDIQLDEIEPNSGNLQKINSPNDLAYMMFTSGSTGIPKGVMIEHRSVVNLVNNLNFIKLNADDKVLQTGSISFDATTFEYWSMLLNGGQLQIISDDDLLDVNKLKSTIFENQITVMWFTAAWFNQLVDIDITLFKPLRFVLVGGDRLSPNHIKLVKEAHPHLKLINGYGPTETTTFALCHNVSSVEHDSIPIGTPVQNSEVYLLDKDRLPVPRGVSGEIYIGGAGLARGYSKQPDLTKERFIDVVVDKLDKKLYRTGDYGKLLNDNTIDFLGRKDNQVKLRGYRIEIAEVEGALLRINDVDEARVIVKSLSNGDKQMVGYVVSKKKLKHSDLIAFLRTSLPEYMCPDHIFCLNSFPLTANGKIDVKRLPDPDNDFSESDGYVAPVNDIEQIMVLVWESVLGKKRIGVNDNFFMIGGDSIKAIQVSSRLQKEGYLVEVKDIFTSPVISQLSKETKKVTRDIDQSMISGEAPLTPIQHDFFNIKRKNPSHFNQSVLLSSSKRLDEQHLNSIFDKLIQHHDILRSVFTFENGTPLQFVRPIGEAFKIKVENLKDQSGEVEKLEKLCDATQRSLNIKDGPLMKVVLFHMHDSDRLLIVIHHLVVDGVSWRILLEDLEMLLRQSQQGQELLLPLKTDSYLTWAQALTEYAKSSKIKVERDYWLNLVKTDVDSIPGKLQTNQNRIGDARMVTVELDEKITLLFLSRAHQAFNTKSNDILLTALGLTFHRTFKLGKILIALEGHGREDISNTVDISRTVGWFTSIFPVVLSDLDQGDIGTLIKETKENLNRIPSKGIGFGILKYLNEDLIHEFEKLNPTISFNYLGQFDAEINNTSFKFSSESLGDSVDVNENRTYDLDITSLILDNKLKFNISYNPNHYQPDLMDRFCDTLKSATSEIIQYCAGRKENELTPSDLTHKGISMSMLDSIKEMID